MKRLIWLSFSGVLLLITSCHTAAPITPVSKVTTITQIRKLDDAHGGPRIIDRYESGKIEETLDPQYKDLTPGSIDVFGIRITEGTVQTTGVYLIFKDVSFPKNPNTPKVSLAYLDKSEVKIMQDAIQSEREYIDKAGKNPPQNQEEMNWESIEGVTIGASISKGNPGYYVQIPLHNGDDSDTFGLTLGPEAVNQLMIKIQGALNLAEGTK